MTPPYVTVSRVLALGAVLLALVALVALVAHPWLPGPVLALALSAVMIASLEAVHQARREAES